MLSREVVITQGKWQSVVEQLDPAREIVTDHPRNYRTFILFGANDTKFRIYYTEIQKLLVKGKLPIWLVAKLTELGAVKSWPASSGRIERAAA